MEKRSRQFGLLIFALSFLVFSILFPYCVLGRDPSEDIHQRILAGAQINFSPSDPESSRTIDAGWIKEAAQKKVRIEIYHAVIQGRLNAGEITFEQEFVLGSCTVKDFADFNHSVFKRKFDIRDISFQSGISFQSATFEREAVFQRSRFESGPVIFDSAHFLETFDAEGAKFISRDHAMTLFINTRFDRMADFAGSVFSVGVDFIATQFGGEAYFPGTRFEGNAEFERSHFAGLATFGADPSNKKFDATFAGKAIFVETQFDSIASFDGVTFGDDVQFYYSRFGTAAQFRGSTFMASCNFFMAKFRGLSNFHGAEFKGDVVFVDATLGNDAYFLGATFGGDAIFNRVQIDGAALFSPKAGAVTSEFPQSARFVHKASFSGARFGSEARFCGVGFNETADFTAAHFDRDAHFEGATFTGAVNFRDSIFRVVYFSANGQVETQKNPQEVGSQNEYSEAEFLSTVDVGGTTYEALYGSWRNLLSRTPFYDRRSYTQLERVFRAAGQGEAADQVHIAQRIAERQQVIWKNRKVFWFFIYIWDIFTYYGVVSWRLFLLPLIPVVVGAWLFLRRGGAKYDSRNGEAAGFTLWNSLRLCIALFLPVPVPLAQKWEPSDEPIFGGFRYTDYAAFLKIWGWIFVPFWVLVLTGFLRYVPS
jgi:uncharacterized protein YjbI with pentapeptide repeats